MERGLTSTAECRLAHKPYYAATTPPLIAPIDVWNTLVGMSKHGKYPINAEEAVVLNKVRNGSAIVDFWNKNNELWAELQCIFNNHDRNAGMIPRDIGTKLILAIEEITRQCTAEGVNPSTRVSGLWALLQIVKWICLTLHWPLDFNKLDLNRTFWWSFDPQLELRTTLTAGQAMNRIVLAMTNGELQLIHRSICQLPILTEMENAIWVVVQNRSEFYGIHIFDNIHLPLPLIERGDLH